MKSYNIKYSGYENLQEYIKNNDINRYNNILVQVFSGITQKEFIEEVIINIKSLIPKCKIIGCTSAAEVFGGKTYTKNCMISITIFEKTKIKTLLLKNEENDFQKGIIIGKKLIVEDTKAIIAFIDMSIDGQKFLDGINYVDNNIVVAGGVAGNSDFVNEGYVFTEQGIEKEAVAVAALDSKTLYVSNESSFNWIPIGKEHEVTNSDGRIIKTIDDIPATEFYKKYIGIKDENRVSYVGSQFPLMIKEGTDYISRPVLEFTKDNALVVSSKIDKGEKIRIGYGDSSQILKGAREVYNKIVNYPVESAYIYSCNSRKRFLKNMIDMELEPISKNSSVTGFYTYGEFNHVNNKNIFYTETMTILMLSEDNNSRLEIDRELLKTYEYCNDENAELYNLIKTTGEELNELNLKLEEKVQEKTRELKRQYYKDGLTNLYNRNKLISDLCDETHNKLAILDINTFNGINDFYGNEVGDVILIGISKLIQSYCNQNKFNAYRLGSDIFAVTSKVDLKEEFISKVRLLQEIINIQCFFYKDFKIYLSVSVGLAEKQENLLEKAEMALNYGKSNNEIFEVYKNELNLYEKIEENIIWTKKIKDAIAQNRIVPYFQPIVNNHLGIIEKFEALIRMIDENGKVISPFFFLEIAKKSGMYKELTRIMIEKTFEVLNKTDYEISINLLFQDITSRETRNLIIEKLETAKDATKVVFEIVESEGIENFNEVTDFIKEIKRYGAKIAIDDFGTGYSNFSYLMKLNVDYIKIDGSIIKNIHKDKSAELVTKTLVSFAKELGIKTVAEFVSDEEIYNKIKSLNIDFSQGYYFSEPKSEIC